MKLLNHVILVSLFSISTFAVGTSLSNGAPGREYLNCVGETKAGAEIRVRVLVELGKGIVLKYYENNIFKSENIVTTNVDSRGVYYVGNPLSVLVPNMQGPQRSIGAYQAILFSGNQSLGVIYCPKN